MSPLLYYNSPVIACTELASRRAAATVYAQLSRRVTALAIISSVAPLLGLLSTILRISASFRSYGASKAAILADLTLHLSEANLPTVAGLFVAITAFCFFRYLSAQLPLFAAEMETATTYLINRLIVHLQKTPSLSLHRPISLPLMLTPPPDLPAPPPDIHLLPPRIWSHGLAELIWPTLNSTADADTSLQHTATVSTAYAIACGLICLWNGRPVAAITVLCSSHSPAPASAPAPISPPHVSSYSVPSPFQHPPSPGVGPSVSAASPLAPVPAGLVESQGRRDLLSNAAAEKNRADRSSPIRHPRRAIRHRPLPATVLALTCVVK
jgi:hypothetical protein